MTHQRTGMRKNKSNIPVTSLAILILLFSTFATISNDNHPARYVIVNHPRPPPPGYDNSPSLHASLLVHSRNLRASFTSGSRKLPMLYICVLLIIQSADTEINPGPRQLKFPCKICSKAVRWNQRGVACDHCSQWLHKACILMTSKEYKRLQDHQNITWICETCDKPNHSSTLFASALADESTNIYSALSESGSSSNSSAHESDNSTLSS